MFNKQNLRFKSSVTDKSLENIPLSKTTLEVQATVPKKIIKPKKLRPHYYSNLKEKYSSNRWLLKKIVSFYRSRLYSFKNRLELLRLVSKGVNSFQHLNFKGSFGKNLQKHFVKNKKAFSGEVLTKKFRSSPIAKKNLFLAKILNRGGRPFSDYSFLLGSKYLYFNFVIKPNNAFFNIKSVLRYRKKSKLHEKYFYIKNKKASDYKISLTKKSLKVKAYAFLTKYLKTLRYLRLTNCKLIVINLVCPFSLRVKFIRTIGNYLKSIGCQNNPNIDILFNVDYKKPFNGCKARKKRRKKRMSIRIYK